MSAVRPRNLVIGLAILVVVAGAGLVGLRKPLLEEGIEWWLSDLDIPLGGLTVAKLDHRAVVLNDISVGPGNLLSAGTVEVNYALPDLIAGEIQAVRLEDLTVAVDLKRDPAQLEKVAALYRRVVARLATGADAAAAPIPQISVGDGRVSIAAAPGSADLPFAARVQADDTGRLTLAADLIAGKIDTPTAVVQEITGPLTVTVAANNEIQVSSGLSMTATPAIAEADGPLALRTKVEAGFDIGGEALDLSVALSSPDAGLDMRADAQLSNVLRQPEGSFALSASIDAAAEALNAIEGLAGGSGRVSADVTGTLSIDVPSGNAVPSQSQTLAAITGNGILAADALVIPNVGRARAESLAFDIAATETSLDLQILPGSVLSIALDDTVRTRAPTAAAGILAGEVTVDFSQSAVAVERLMQGDGAARWRAEIQPRLALRAQDGGRLTLRSTTALEGAGGLQLSSVEGEADLVLEDLSVTLPEIQTGSVRADLALGFAADPKTLDVRLLRPGALALDGLSTKNLQTKAPVDFVLTSGGFKIDGAETPERRFSASLDMQPDGAIRTVIRDDATADRTVEALLGPVRLTGTGVAGDCATGNLAIEDATLSLDGEAVELEETRVTVSRDCHGGGLLASAFVSSAQHRADRPLLAPLTARANLTDTAEGYTFDGAVSLVDGAELFVFTGDAAAGGSSGEITVARTQPLVFTADGPSPADFSATLGAVKRIRGEIDGSARYRWSDGETSSTARLDLRELSFDIGAVAVRDLDLGLALQPVWPPVTPTGQTLSIGRIDVGAAFEEAALEQIELDFDLLPTEPTQLRINSLVGRFLDGMVDLDSFTVDPAQPRTETVLRVADLDMAALAALAKMEDLTVTGRLGGKIPIILDDGKLAIRGGRLDAAGPGRLSYSSVEAAALLRGQGEEVDLMLQALQDFRYETLGLDLDKTAGNDLSIKLSLLGSNPEVLDGHPFRVNLNLTSQITPVLDALATLYQMSRETLERVWTTR